MKTGIEMNHQSPLRENYLLTIETDENMSIMVVSMRSDYWHDIILLFLFVLLVLPFCFASGASNDSSFVSWSVMALIMLGLILRSIYTKRSLKFVIKRSSGTIRYERGGFLDTFLFTESRNYTISEIAGFEIKHYSRGDHDRFRILVVLKSGERLYLLDLGLLEYQSTIDKIHNFINPQLPIQVIGTDWTPW
jgi:hypothetical protein